MIKILISFQELLTVIASRGTIMGVCELRLHELIDVNCARFTTIVSDCEYLSLAYISCKN